MLKTFPNIADQLSFVSHGSEGAGIGSVYGDPNREGGPHIAGSFNGNHMPAFEKALKPEELLAVVRHERETLSGEELTPEETGPGGTRLWPNGNPIFVKGSTELVGPDGTTLLDPETGNLLVASAGGSAAPSAQ